MAYYFLFAWIALCLSVQAKVLPFFPQAWFFDWNPPGQLYPIPVTAQCDTINITWGRGAATGPNPIGPYYLQVYSSQHLYPFIIPAGDNLTLNWAVPFAPGTLYQICMFDKNGNTGGCQATYTVIPPANGTATCQNLTAPATPLNVNGIVNNGPLSRYGWIPSCTDISITPVNGTPPYIMTVAPSLHPPVNITSMSVAAMNWTVNLSWASPFWVSVVDANGNAWANGLMHSGQGDTSCLSGDIVTKRLSTGASVGVGVGSAVFGALLALLAAQIFRKARDRHRHIDEMAVRRKSSTDGEREQLHGEFPAPPTADPNRLVPLRYTADSTTPLGSANSLGYQVEPFSFPAESSRTAEMRSPLMDRRPPMSHVTRTSELGSFSDSQSAGPMQGSQVLILQHADAHTPSMVFRAENVVELPPGYNDHSSASSGIAGSQGQSARSGTGKQ